MTVHIMSVGLGQPCPQRPYRSEDDGADQDLVETAWVVRHVRRGDVGLRVRVPDAEEEIGRWAMVLAVDDVADASDGR
jgi:hypothetical protein